MPGIDDSFRKKIISIVLGLAFGLFGLELFLRLLGFGYTVIYNLPQDKGAQFRIFCVGESTTWGIGADNPILQGYPHQLEEMLNNKFPEIKFQCFYDNTIGQNTSEILRKLPAYIKDYRPDLMIFMVGINNWWNLDHSNILLFNKNKLISESVLRISVFLDRFRVWKLLKWICYSMGMKKERWDYSYYKGHKYESIQETAILEKQCNFDIFDKIAYYDLKEMIKICNRNKIKMVISSYPRRAVGGIYSIQNKISREFNIPFADNYLFFKKTANTKEYISSDGWHPNGKGYKLVAENIYNCILNNNIIK
jgi:lysophospholipase L1-like esterase